MRTARILAQPIHWTKIKTTGNKLPSVINNEATDLKVFFHHIYEYKKGIRKLILTTEKSIYKQTIENRLKNEKINYVINDVTDKKINVFFGADDCVEVIRTFNPKLNKITPEQDFILGTMLGYDIKDQCARYLQMKKKGSILAGNLIG